MRLTPDEQREHDRDLGKAVAAYMRWLDEIVPESQYGPDKREDTDRTAHLDNILNDALARRRERVRRSGAP
ncbi:hypothetical protein D0T12_28395 [Actinomadura spongiicola]|uniref:Uncharacterized protein n=1 Tax=Actinomadura spongiicola TaxID=2303421 RepID=A0A372GAQ7_9ACTN|nr:hypothetical protein [Actinomadura spongiicola]RFS82163.1 hypothetical protein D0T12_28395 [Actinomadura spongiicola]